MPRGRAPNYCWLVKARKTWSSTTTPRVNRVAVVAPGTATRLAWPLRAAPAGLAPDTGASPGCSEMRVVFAVQFVAPTQVSRTKTWRNPLFGEPAVALARAEDFAWLGVTATNATKRPDALTDGKMLSVPTSAPLESVEISCVDGVHELGAPTQVSRRYTWRPDGASGSKLVAAELNAT